MSAICASSGVTASPGATWDKTHYAYEGTGYSIPVDLTGVTAEQFFCPKNEATGKLEAAVLTLTSADGSLVIEADKVGTASWTDISALPAPTLGEVWILTEADPAAPTRVDGSAAVAGDGLRFGTLEWTNIGPTKGSIRENATPEMTGDLSPRQTLYANMWVTYSNGDVKPWPTIAYYVAPVSDVDGAA